MQMMLNKTGWVVSNLDKDASGQTLFASLLVRFTARFQEPHCCIFPNSLSFNLADPGKLSDPEMPQPYLLTGKQCDTKCSIRSTLESTFTKKAATLT